MKKVLLWVLLVAPASILATVWHVVPSCRGTGIGTISNPWCGFRHIEWSSVRPGDTITGDNRRFTETLRIPKSGSDNHPIIIRDMELAGQSDHGITNVDNTGYFVFDHLKVHDVGGIGILMRGASDIEIKNTTFTNNGRNTSRYGHIRITQIPGSKVGNIKIHDNTFSGDQSWSWDTENILILQTDAAINNLVISNNTITGGYSGIRIMGPANPIGIWGLSPTGVVMEHNRLDGQRHSAIQTGTGINGAVGTPSRISFNAITHNGTQTGGNPSKNVNALQLNWVRNITVEGNYIQTVRTTRPDGNGIILDDCWRDRTYASSGNTIRYNWIEDCPQGSGVSVFWGRDNIIHHNIISSSNIGIKNGSSFSSGNAYYSNIISNATTAGAMLSDGRDRIGSPVSIWKNNIIVGCSYAFTLKNGSAMPKESFNCIYNNLHNGLLLDRSDITCDPMLTDALRLAKRSPCFKTGAELPGELKDLTATSVWPDKVQTIPPTTHIGPWSQSGFVPPYVFKKFREVLDVADVQGNNHTICYNRRGEIPTCANEHFHVADTDKMEFAADKDFGHRSEIRQRSGDWDSASSVIHTNEGTLEIEKTGSSVEEQTFMQWHHTVPPDPHFGPIVRLFYRPGNFHGKHENIWAVCRTNLSVKNPTHEMIPLGPKPNGYFTAKLSAGNNLLNVWINGVHKIIDRDMSMFAGLHSYFKNGTYFKYRDDGGDTETKVRYSDLAWKVTKGSTLRHRIQVVTKPAQK